MIDRRVAETSEILNQLQERDNNIYRSYFEANPIPEEQRKAGFGGVNRYKKAYDPNNNSDADLSDYTSWSIRFVSEEHPEWVKENLLQDIKTDFDSNNYFMVNPFEIYNANVMSEPKSIWPERKKIAQKKEYKNISPPSS